MNRRPAPPLPLGFVALAAGTLLLATLNLGWLEPADGREVAISLLAFVAPLQLAASLVGFALGEVVPATAMGVLAGSWTVTGIDMLVAPVGSTSAGLGAQLLVTAAAMALAGLLAAVRGSLLPAAVITGAAIRFAATGAYELSASPAWERAAGWIGVALAALAACVAGTLGWEAARSERRAAGA